MSQLDPAIIEAYRRDGAVVLRGVFERHWLKSIARGIERNFVDPGPGAMRYTPEGEPGGFYDDYCNWKRIEEYRRFAFDSPAAGLVGALMGSSEVRFYHEHVIVKEPGTRELTPWHHDLPYYGLEGSQLCSLWLPLDPVPRSVCPQFVATSHRWGRRFVPRKFVDHEEYGEVPEGYEPAGDIDAQLEGQTILSWGLEPGDCIAFHMLAVHGAPGTQELRTRRRGFVTRWLGDDVRFAARPWKTSPPFEEVDLQPGDRMNHPSFPLVSRASSD